MDFATQIASRIEDLARDSKVLLLLSGGSSAAVGVAAVSLLTPATRANVSIGLTDERYGNHNHADSNWRLLEEKNLLSYPVAAYLPMLTTEPQTMEEAAHQYEQCLRNSLTEDTRLVAVFGIGMDDHIAGILPGSVAAHESEKFVVAYDAGAFQRITISPAFFRHISEAFVFAQGVEKSEAIMRLATVLDPVSHPDQLVKETASHTILYRSEVL